MKIYYKEFDIFNEKPYNEITVKKLQNILANLYEGKSYGYEYISVIKITDDAIYLSKEEAEC